MELFSIRIQRTFQLVSTVDEKYKCIYGINLETNEDAILKFNLK